MTFPLETIKAALRLFGELAVSFVRWLTDWFKTYAQLAFEAEDRYLELDAGVRELVKRRKSIESMCLYPADQTARSQCIHAIMDVSDVLSQARRDRNQARRTFELYKAHLS